MRTYYRGKDKTKLHEKKPDEPYSISLKLKGEDQQLYQTVLDSLSGKLGFRPSSTMVFSMVFKDYVAGLEQGQK